MLEKPNIRDEKIIDCLRDEFGLHVGEVAFLPLGADVNTAVFRATTHNATPYFVKLRRGHFDETSVTLPKYLSEQGNEKIMAPLPTQTGQLWGKLENYKVILYPFVEGRNGYEVGLSDDQWREFGAALKRFHTTHIPPLLSKQIRRETYAPNGRHFVKTCLDRAKQDRFDDPVAIEVAALLQSNRDQILDIIVQAEKLCQGLQKQLSEFVVCHSDIHAGNLLIESNGGFYIVDWDDPILAPKERDLMYIGGGLLGHWRSPREEETLFYKGYGNTQVNPMALAYYRFERIIRDIAAYCEELLLTNEGGEDRAQSLRYLKSNFLPNQTIEIAYRQLTKNKKRGTKNG